MMRSYVRVFALLGVIAATLGGQQVLAVSTGPVLLGFGETYQSGADRSVHRGVDLAGFTGDAVVVPVEGEVSFAGRVPGQAGGSVMAVSIRVGQDTLSLSPLERVDVEKGQRLRPGDSVGLLAGVGDPSSAQPHIHLSLRREGVYLDPAHLLVSAPLPVPTETQTQPTLAPATTEPEPVAVAAPVAAPVVQPAAAPAPTMVTAAPPIADVEIGTASEPDASAARSAVPRDATVPSGSSASSRGSVLSPGVSLSPTPSDAKGSIAVSPWSAAGTSVLARLGSAVRGRGVLESAAAAITGHSQVRGGDLRAATPRDVPNGRRVGATARSPFTTSVRPAVRSLGAGSSAALTPAGAGLIVSSLLGIAFLLSRRTFERRLLFSQPVSDRFGSMLQHLRAGDTLCGLTSCSGLLPSQSRGRLAQRR